MDRRTLYHGTSSVNLPSIRSLGLVPGHAKGGDAWAKENDWSLAKTNREPSVFLMDIANEAEQFAHLSVREMGGDAVVITVHVPEQVFVTFVPDELFSHNTERGHQAWRAHSVAPQYIGEVTHIADELGAAEKIQLIGELRGMLGDRHVG